MVHRIHFTGQDLARTRVAGTPLPMCELRLALSALRSRAQPARMDAWRRDVRGRLPAAARAALSTLSPDLWSPGFLPVSLTATAGELIEQIRATPRAAVRAQVATLAERRPVPKWVWDVPGDPALLQRQCDGLGLLYAALLAPYWDQVTGLHLADRTVRMRDLLGGGVERLLSEAAPRWMRWNPPVLEIETDTDQDLVLEGEGVLLVPSVFRVRPCVEAEAVPQPIVSYPASSDRPLQRLTAFAPTTSPAVSALLGPTRSAVLTVIAEHPGCSTKELAAFAGIAPASASEHATVLREAGLIRTTRHRNAVLHSPTGLGVSLLDAPS